MTYAPNNVSLQQLTWRHKGYGLNSKTNPRIVIRGDAGITINAVEPLDAGFYEVIISSDIGCDSAQIEVFVECEL